MTRSKIRLVAHPTGGARAELLMRNLKLDERAHVFLAMLWAVLSGELRIQIPHTATSVRGQLVQGEED